jgi:tetratricopeptide (TPR) repeat protein
MGRYAIMAAALLVLSWVGGSKAIADQSDSRLDDLFSELKSAGDPSLGYAVEQRIVLIWLESGNDEANRMMREGIGAMNGGNLGLALETFDRMVEIAPDFAEAWNKRATVHFLMGDYRASIADIDRTLLLEPRHFLALSGLGMVEIQLDNPANAIDAFKRALSIHPQMPGPRANIEYLRRQLDKNAI